MFTRGCRGPKVLKTTLLVALGLGEDQAGKRFQSPKLSFFLIFLKEFPGI